MKYWQKMIDKYSLHLEFVITIQQFTFSTTSVILLVWNLKNEAQNMIKTIVRDNRVMEYLLRLGP